MAEKTRAYAARVDILAPTERVWAALTTTEALQRWMSPDSRIKAQQGGSLLANLDRRKAFSAHVDVFDPPRRVRLVHLHPDDLPLFDGAIVDDVLIEARSADTIVRVLGSGFPRAAEFGDFYMRRQLGWRQALARLKVYLEKRLDQQPAINPVNK